VYLPTGVALFSAAPDAQVPVFNSGATFAAQVSSKSAWAVMNEFGEDALTSTNDLPSALDTLASGSAQYVAADAVIGTYAAHNRALDAHIIALMQQAGGYCIGVLDDNTDLKTAISEAVFTLSGNGVFDVVMTKWLGAPLDLSATPMTAGVSGSAGVSQDADAKKGGDSTDDDSRVE